MNYYIVKIIVNLLLFYMGKKESFQYFVLIFYLDILVLIL